MLSRRIIFLFILICIGFFLLVNYLSTKTKPKIGAKQGNSQIKELENRIPLLESQIISEDPLAWIILLAKIINDPYLEARILSTVAITYLETGRENKAIELLSEAFQVAKAIKAVPGWKEAALKEIGRAYAKLGQYEKALNLVDETIKEDSSKIFFWAEISAKFEGIGQDDKASLALMRALQKIEDKDKEGALRKVETLVNIAKNVYIRAGRKDKAIEFLNQALQEMEIKKDSFPFYNKIELWTRIGEGYAEVGHYEKALEIWTNAMKVGEKNIYWETFKWKDELSEEIMKGFIETGRYKEALKLTETIANPYLKARVLSKIVNVYIETGQKTEAAELLSQTLQVAQSISEERAGKAMILGSLAVKYIKIGQDKKALQIIGSLNKVVDVGEIHFQFETLIKIADYYLSVGNKVKSKEFLDHALQLVRTEARYLIEIAGKYIKVGEKEEASELLTEANQLAEAKEDNITKVERFIEIADFYIATGQNDKALEFLTKALKVAQNINKSLVISRHYVLDVCGDALDKIAVKCVELKHYEIALQAIKAILGDPGLTLHTLTKIGVILAKDGHRISKDESKILQEIIDKFK